MIDSMNMKGGVTTCKPAKIEVTVWAAANDPTTGRDCFADLTAMRTPSRNKIYAVLSDAAARRGQFADGPRRGAGLCGADTQQGRPLHDLPWRRRARWMAATTRRRP